MGEGGELRAAPGAEEDPDMDEDGRSGQIPETNDQPTNVYITAVDMQGSEQKEPHIGNVEDEENDDTEE